MQAWGRKNGRYRNDQGGLLAWLLYRQKRNLRKYPLTKLSGVSESTGEKEGEETVNIKHTDAT